MEIAAERHISKLEFDDLPYLVKVETVAHWELKQEIAEYYNQKQEAEMNKNRNR